MTFKVAACGLMVLGLALEAVTAGAEGNGAQPSEPYVQEFARRGSTVLSRAQLDAFLNRIPDENRAAVIRNPERFEDMIENLMLSKQLAEAAEAAGYDEDPMVRRRMALAAEEELAKAWMAHFLTTVEDADTNALAREYYLTHEEEFMTELTIDVTHILIGIEKRSREDALALTRELHERVVENPESFDELVMEYSEDPSVGRNRGRFTNVARGRMVEGFEEAAFALGPGEISGPVRSPYGYHLIRLDAREEPRMLAFEEVRPALRRNMAKQHRERAQADYLRKLQEQPLEVDEEALEDLAEDYFDLADANAAPEPGEGIN